MKRARQLNTPLSVKILDWPGRFTVPIHRAGNSPCRFHNGTLNCKSQHHEQAESLVPPKRVLLSLWQVASFDVLLCRSGLDQA